MVAPIVILSLSLVFFATFVVASFANYFNRFKVRYTPRNMFPYELNLDGTFKDNLIGNICLLLSSVSLIAFYAFLWNKGASGFFTLTVVAGMLSAICLSGSTFVPLKYLKGHLIVDVLTFVSTFVALVGGACASLIEYLNFRVVGSIVIFAFSALFALIYFAILINPKIARWSKLEQHFNSDGTSYFTRPKFFTLAYTEWLTTLFIFIAAMLAFLQTIFS